jgi:hypothetical protein
VIAAAILAARRLAQYPAGPKVPATICAKLDFGPRFESGLILLR